MTVKGYAKYLMVMAGLGGLLYGIDVGVIAAALPYIRNTANYGKWELGFVVSAVLWGSVLSSLFAGSLAEWFGRKKIKFWIDSEQVEVTEADISAPTSGFGKDGIKKALNLN